MDHGLSGPPRIRFVPGVHESQSGDWDPLLALLHDEGPARLGDNLVGRVRLIQADGTLLPLLEVESHAAAADVCSPLSRYVRYPLAEAKRWAPRPARPLLGLGLAGWRVLLKGLHLERAVYVNNFLLATNPVPAADPGVMARLVAWLVDQYPTHAVVVRTVIPALEPAYAKALIEAGGRPVPTRLVHIIDTADPAFVKRKNVRWDRALLARTPYRPVAPADSSAVDVDRMVALYRGLYLDRHSPYNAAFGARFFEALLRSPRMRWVLFEAPGRGTFDGFSGWFENAGYLTGAVVGYDLSMPRGLGLYRQLIMHQVLRVAEPRGWRVNLSGGARAFKLHRGARPVADYDVVFDQHLPRWRRLPWWLVAREGEFFIRDGTGHT